mmetsp:Transcript_10496/g.33234  ORF Transcript_10496/g.33234 Transcript_10496/m.33234 type:complete len:294 (+) Transcript_10496:607-1488(+)
MLSCATRRAIDAPPRTRAVVTTWLSHELSSGDAGYTLVPAPRRRSTRAAWASTTASSLAPHRGSGSVVCCSRMCTSSARTAPAAAWLRCLSVTSGHRRRSARQKSRQFHVRRHASASDASAPLPSPTPRPNRPSITARTESNSPCTVLGDEPSRARRSARRAVRVRCRSVAAGATKAADARAAAARTRCDRWLVSASLIVRRSLVSPCATAVGVAVAAGPVVSGVHRETRVKTAKTAASSPAASLALASRSVSTCGDDEKKSDGEKEPEPARRSRTAAKRSEAELRSSQLADR